jgi:hypothetical protein
MPTKMAGSIFQNVKKSILHTADAEEEFDEDNPEDGAQRDSVFNGRQTCKTGTADLTSSLTSPTRRKPERDTDGEAELNASVPLENNHKPLNRDKLQADIHL